MSASLDTPTEEDSPTHGAPVQRRRARVFTALGVVFALLAVAFAGMLAFTWSEVADIERHDLTLAAVGADEPQNYLIVGSDSRAEIDESDADAAGFVGDDQPDVVGQRADVIMVARVDPAAGEVHLLSLPRDLWVPIAGTGKDQRINTAYSLDNGRQRLIDTIEQDFGIPINHYVEVDFRGFEGIVDAIDGIPLEFERAVRDENSGLFVDAPGCRVLDGGQALAFARSRHLEYLDDKGRWRTDGSADLGRISRQQVFMRALLERAAGESLDLGDLGDGYTLLTTVSDYVSVDSELDVDLMVALAREFQGFGADGLQTHTLAVEPYTTDGGAAVLEWHELPSQEVLNLFRGDPPGTLDPSLVSVTVWNGSGEPGQAGDAQEALEATGFEVPEIDDAPEVVEATVVRYAPGMEVAAQLVARHLEHGAVLEEDEDLDDEELVLVTGPEFGAVLDEPAAEVATPTTGGGSGSSDGQSPSGSDGDEELVSTAEDSTSEDSTADGEGDGGEAGSGSEGEVVAPPTTEPPGVIPAEVAPGGC